MPTRRSVIYLAGLLLIAGPTQSCELLFEAGELELAGAEFEALGVRAAGAGAFAEGATALRSALAAEEIALPRGPLAAGLDAGAAETAAGRGAMITRGGSIVARGRTWGRVSAGGEIFMTEGSEVAGTRVGRIANGLVWAPDRGGNLLPIARVRGTLKTATYKLRAQMSGPESSVSVTEATELDVLRVNDDWFEVRIGGTKQTGWIEAAALSVALLRADGFDTVAGAILACVRHDSASGIDARAATELRDSQNVSLTNRWVILRYPSSAVGQADTVAALLARDGMHVARQEVDIPATETCGAEIYYHRSDFRAARNLQTRLIGIRRLRISSFDVDRPRLLVWLR